MIPPVGPWLPVDRPVFDPAGITVGAKLRVVGDDRYLREEGFTGLIVEVTHLSYEGSRPGWLCKRADGRSIRLETDEVLPVDQEDER